MVEMSTSLGQLIALQAFNGLKEMLSEYKQKTCIKQSFAQICTFYGIIQLNNVSDISRTNNNSLYNIFLQREKQ